MRFDEAAHSASVRRDRTIAPTTPDSVRSGAAIVLLSPYMLRVRAAMRSVILAAAPDESASDAPPSRGRPPARSGTTFGHMERPARVASRTVRPAHPRAIATRPSRTLRHGVVDRSRSLLDGSNGSLARTWT